MKKKLITSGVSFIESALIRHIINNTNHYVINVDKLTYAGNLESLSEIEGNKRYSFEQIDICKIDASKIFKTLGWSPDENFNSGILKTVEWYLNNKVWWEKLQVNRNKGTVE